MANVAIYARFSTENQKDESIEDQVRECKEYCTKNNWTIHNIYTDHAVSGSTLIRPGIQQLIQDAMSGKVDIVLAEALDRISRDQEDIAGLFKRFQFADVTLETIQEGTVIHLHIGLKGTMNAMYISDLKHKIKRGQRGRVESGKIGGGNCYGYDVVRGFDLTGKQIRGERKINAIQARIIRRIFKEYAEGCSPKKIAANLNEDNIPGPVGKGWGPTTIYGNWQRGSGILNNELYIGQLVWNKVSYPKNPDTGKHVTRNNPPEEWIRQEVPELRIIDQKLWEEVKKRQLKTRRSHKKFWEHQRPVNLFSYLLKCGCCGGGISKISKKLYGCSTARNKGKSLCDNRLTIKQEILELTVIKLLREQLMDPKLVEVFCEEYTNHLNYLRREHNASIYAFKKEIEQITRSEDKMIEAICEGFANEQLKEKMNAAQLRKDELKRLINEQHEEPIMLHPNMASRYRQEVTSLIKAMNDPERKNQATDLVRSLIDRIVLTPDKKSNTLLISLYGDLAGILNLAINKKNNKNKQELDLKHIRLMIGLDQDISTLETQIAVGEKNTNGKKTIQQDKMVGLVGLEPTTERL